MKKQLLTISGITASLALAVTALATPSLVTGTPARSAAEIATPAAAALAKRTVKEPGFKLSLRAKGDYKVGEEGKAVLVLRARGGRKCNAKYPYKFSVTESEGLELAANPVKKGAAKVGKRKLVLPIRFTPTSAGKKRLEGEFKFSVCTPQACEVEKRVVGVDIDVSE